MTSPSHAAPDRSPAAGEETAGRSPRKRVTVITATALSLLEACGLGPSPSRPDKMAGKEGRAPQGDAPLPGRSWRTIPRHGRRKSRHLPGGGAAGGKRRPRRTGPPDSGGQAAGGRGAADRCRRQHRGPGGPSGDPVRTGHAARTCRLPEKNAARRRRAGSPAAAPVTGAPTVPPARSRRAGRHTGSGPCGWPAFRGCGGSRSGCGTDGAACRARRSSASGGRGRKKAAGMPPASAGETASAVAPAEEQAPGRPRMRRHGLPRRTVWRRNTVCRHRAAGWWCCPGMRTGTIFPPQGMTGRLTPGPRPAPS